MYRLYYLEKMAEVTGQPYAKLLKKEASLWLDYTFNKLTLVGGGEFEPQYGQIVNEKQKIHKIIYFKYIVRYCHVYLDSNPENNLLKILKIVFMVTPVDAEFLLRMKIKSFLKENKIYPEKKLKFFSKDIRFNDISLPI